MVPSAESSLSFMHFMDNPYDHLHDPDMKACLSPAREAAFQTKFHYISHYIKRQTIEKEKTDLESCALQRLSLTPHCGMIKTGVQFTVCGDNKLISGNPNN